MKAELYKEIHDKLNNLGAFGMLIHDSDNITQNDICKVLRHYPIATDGCEFTMWDFRMKDRLQNQSDMFGRAFLALFDSKKDNELPMSVKLYHEILARMNELGAIRQDWTIGVIFTDCILAIKNSVDEDLREDFEAEYHEAIMSVGSIWDLRKPYLDYQSNELGQKLLDLISKSIKDA